MQARAPYVVLAQAFKPPHQLFPPDAEAGDHIPGGPVGVIRPHGGRVGRIGRREDRGAIQELLKAELVEVAEIVEMAKMILR